MRKLTIVFFDAGGGHRNAAEALRSILETQPHPWDVCLLNLQELLDSIDVLRNTTGLRIQDGYNLILRKGWTRFTPQLLPLLRGAVRLRHKRVVELLKSYGSQHPADVVLSVIPLFNRALAESIRAVTPRTAFVTLLTDFADCPPHFWIEPESEYIICGTERARQQALFAGHPRSQIFEASGMVLKPKFYETPPVDLAWERQHLGLVPTLPTGVVLFGGQGSPVMIDIARRLDESSDEFQLILLCGHNQKLLAELKSMRLRKPVLVQGFTPHVDYYMSLADFFIGKPGPGCISEALQFHLPVIVESNSRTMPQERYNSQWLLEKRLGIVVPSFREIASGVRHLLQEDIFDELRRNARAYRNRALFEIPLILDEVFERHVPELATVSSPSEDMDVFGQGAAWAGSH